VLFLGPVDVRTVYGSSRFDIFRSDIIRRLLVDTRTVSARPAAVLHVPLLMTWYGGVQNVVSDTDGALQIATSEWEPEVDSLKMTK
jgi:hypothetical protein